MLEWYETLNNNGSRKNGRRISRCKRRWRKSIERCSRCMMVKEGRRKLGARADTALGGMKDWIEDRGHVHRNQKMCPSQRRKKYTGKQRYPLFARPGGRTCPGRQEKAKSGASYHRSHSTYAPSKTLARGSVFPTVPYG